MDPEPTPEAALGVWLAGGITSRSHPVLEFALRTFLNPLGIEAESLEAEPFSALESGVGTWWLRQPAWNPSRFDPGHPAAPDIRAILDHADEFTVAVDDQGILAPALNSQTAGPEARRFVEDREAVWRAVRHTIHASQDAEAFIFAAAGLILANDPAAAAYARGDHSSFCASVLGRLREAAGESRESGDG